MGAANGRPFSGRMRRDTGRESGQTRRAAGSGRPTPASAGFTLRLLAIGLVICIIRPLRPPANSQNVCRYSDGAAGLIDLDRIVLQKPGLPHRITGQHGQAVCANAHIAQPARRAMILLQDTGVINRIIMALGFEKLRLIRTQLGVTIGMVQILLPFMVMPLYAVMRGIDLRLVQAAGSLGARPIMAFFQIYLPLSLPGLLAGAVIVFILSLGFYITPLLLGGPSSAMLSTLIQQQVLSLLNWGKGGAMSVILLLATFGFLAIVAPFMRRKYAISGSGK